MRVRLGTTMWLKVGGSEYYGSLIGVLIGTFTWGMWKHLISFSNLTLEFGIGVPLLVLGGVFVSWGILTTLLKAVGIQWLPKWFLAYLVAFTFTLGAWDFLWSIATGGLGL